VSELVHLNDHIVEPIDKEGQVGNNQQYHEGPLQGGTLIVVIVLSCDEVHPSIHCGGGN